MVEITSVAHFDEVVQSSEWLMIVSYETRQAPNQGFIDEESRYLEDGESPLVFAQVDIDKVPDIMARRDVPENPRHRDSIIYQ
jgi:hypothetical protein